VQTAIAGRGGIAIGVVADLTKHAGVARLRRDIERQLGPIGVVVANAGGNPTRPRPLEEISEEGWRASVDANLTSTFFTRKCFLPGMKQRRSGNIITMSSAAARRAHPMSPIPYSAAKAGIHMLTQHLATQVERDNSWAAREQQHEDRAPDQMLVLYALGYTTV
jgi:3-oxoacyl-[acyl-carrier protein] reductase